MTEQLSVFELMVNASLLVQFVMLLLVLASVVSWVMIFQRWFALNRVQREMDDFEDYFWSGIDLRQLFSELDESEALTGIENVFVPLTNVAIILCGRLSACFDLPFEARKR